MTSSSPDPIMVAEDALTYLSILLDYIETQDWPSFQQYALSNPQTFVTISKTIDKSQDLHGMTLLHAIVRFDPPLEMLKRMIKLYPQALKGEDCIGRTPLHVATGSGASTPIIKLLTASYPEACAVQDEDGRTPLHFACDTSCELFEGGEYNPRNPPSLETVRVLLSGSLRAVVLEDVDEMNAVEYAIFSNASIEVVNLLQRATQKVRKKELKEKNEKKMNDENDNSLGEGVSEDNVVEEKSSSRQNRQSHLSASMSRILVH